MNKTRNHAVGISLTAAALAATLLTGCGDFDAECEVEARAYSASLVTGKSGGTSGGGSRGGGSVGKPSAPNMNKGPAKQPLKGGTTGGSSSGGSSAKSPKIDWDEDCEGED